MRTEAFVVGHGRVRRRRDRPALLFRHRLPVTVAEIPDTEAPVALIVRRTQRDVYRRHAGSYWFRVAGIGPHDLVSPEGFVDLVSGGGASSWTRNPFAKEGRKTGTVPGPLDVSWPVEDDGLRDAERVAQAACADLMFIGGVLHRRVAEPVWRVTYAIRDRQEISNGVRLPRWHAGLAVDHDGRPAEFWSASRFRIDAVEEVTEFLSGLPERDQARSVPEVEVFSPVLRAPLAEAAPPDRLPALPGLASMPDAVLLAYAGMADLQTPGLADLAVLVDLLTGVVRGNGPESHAARCLVSDIAFPVVLGSMFPDAVERIGLRPSPKRPVWPWG